MAIRSAWVRTLYPDIGMTSSKNCIVLKDKMDHRFIAIAKNISTYSPKIKAF